MWQLKKFVLGKTIRIIFINTNKEEIIKMNTYIDEDMGIIVIFQS